MAQRKYCKNTVPGRQGRGKKYPAKVRAEVVMTMISANSICAVARKYGVPESTIRSWMAEEAKKPDGVFAEARAQAAREIAARAALGARAQVGYLQQRVAENQRAQKHSVHYNGFFRFRHNIQPPFSFVVCLPGTTGIYSYSPLRSR